MSDVDFVLKPMKEKNAILTFPRNLQMSFVITDLAEYNGP